MAKMLVRYRLKPGKEQENERLIERVFQELNEKGPEDVRYLCMKLGDGTFIHFVDDSAKFIPGLPAFQSFRSGIAERCSEAPQQSDVTIVGNYRMIAD